jgi:hypothetical protein
MFTAKFLHFVQVKAYLPFKQSKLLFVCGQLQAMMRFHIAGQTRFQLSRFLVFTVAVNQPDERFRVSFAAYQRLDNLHKTCQAFVLYATD